MRRRLRPNTRSMSAGVMRSILHRCRDRRSARSSAAARIAKRGAPQQQHGRVVGAAVARARRDQLRAALGQRRIRRAARRPSRRHRGACARRRCTAPAGRRTRARAARRWRRRSRRCRPCAPGRRASRPAAALRRAARKVSSRVSRSTRPPSPARQPVDAAVADPGDQPAATRTRRPARTARPSRRRAGRSGARCALRSRGRRRASPRAPRRRRRRRPSSAPCSESTSRRLASCAIAPPPTPSATTKTPLDASRSLWASSLSACWLPHDDATADFDAAERRRRGPHCCARPSACRGRRCAATDGSSGVIRLPGIDGSSAHASGVPAAPAASVQAGWSSAAAPSTIVSPSLPAAARARRVAHAVDRDAVVAVHDHLGAVVVELDDVEVVARHAVVAPVDDQRLVARAADRDRQHAPLSSSVRSAGRLQRGDLEAPARRRAPAGSRSAASSAQAAAAIGVSARRRRCGRPHRQPRVVARRPFGARRQHDARAFASRTGCSGSALTAAPLRPCGPVCDSTRMPFVEPASATHQAPLSSQISAWRRLV